MVCDICRTLHLQIERRSWANYIQNGDIEDEPGFEDALTIPWWLELSICTDTVFPILEMFGNVQQWTEKTDGLRSFGDAETNEFCVCFDHETNKVQELSCRLDLRQIDEIFVEKVLSTAVQFNCLLMDKQGRLFEPKRATLADTIKLSNANRFVDNPEQFLRDLSKGIVTPE